MKMISVKLLLLIVSIGIIVTLIQTDMSNTFRLSSEQFWYRKDNCDDMKINQTVSFSRPDYNILVKIKNRIDFVNNLEHKIQHRVNSNIKHFFKVYQLETRKPVYGNVICYRYDCENEPHYIIGTYGAYDFTLYDPDAKLIIQQYFIQIFCEMLGKIGLTLHNYILKARSESSGIDGYVLICVDIHLTDYFHTENEKFLFLENLRIRN